MSSRALAVVVAVSIAAVVSAARAGPLAAPPAPPAPSTPPAPEARIPTGPRTLAGMLAATDGALRAAIAAWRTTGDPAMGTPPDDVTLDALYVQRVLRKLSRNPTLARRTLRHLPARFAHDARQIIASLRDIRRLAAGHRPRPRRVRTGPPAPLGVLIGYYREAQRRFGVGVHVLAAVNLVESAFGRLRNDSVAGAQGPMQFIPSTWRAYGMGGDVHDPHDAILGAANYLRASGAPNYRHALYHYNPSPLYVNAVRRFARLIHGDPDALYALYSWQVFVRVPGGERRVTGPGT